jgi:hypothetical protein
MGALPHTIPTRTTHQRRPGHPRGLGAMPRRVVAVDLTPQAVEQVAGRVLGLLHGLQRQQKEQQRLISAGPRTRPQRPARYGGARSSLATVASCEPRSRVLKTLGRVRGVRRMNAAAREAVARTYAEILCCRHPGTQWIVRPVDQDMHCS